MLCRGNHETPVSPDLLSAPLPAWPVGSLTAACSCVASGQMTLCCSAGNVYVSHAALLPHERLLRCDIAAALQGRAPPSPTTAGHCSELPHLRRCPNRQAPLLTPLHHQH